MFCCMDESVISSFPAECPLFLTVGVVDSGSGRSLALVTSLASIGVMLPAVFAIVFARPRDISPPTSTKI